MASKSVAELKAQLEKAQAELEAAIAEESAQVLADIREKVATYGFTEKDVFGRKRVAGKTPGAPVEAKYQNPKTGETWSGRGPVVVGHRDGSRMRPIAINF